MNSQLLMQPDEFFQAGQLFWLHINRLLDTDCFDKALLFQQVDKRDFDMVMNAEFADGDKVVRLHGCSTDRSGRLISYVLPDRDGRHYNVANCRNRSF